MDEITQNTLLTMLFGFIVISTILIVLPFIISPVLRLILRVKKHLEWKKMKSKECKGMHTWYNVENMYRVCEECGKVSNSEAFVDSALIKEIKKVSEMKVNLDQERDLELENSIVSICKKHGINRSAFDDISLEMEQFYRSTSGIDYSMRTKMYEDKRIEMSVKHKIDFKQFEEAMIEAGEDRLKILIDFNTRSSKLFTELKDDKKI